MIEATSVGPPYAPHVEMDSTAYLSRQFDLSTGTITNTHRENANDDIDEWRPFALPSTSRLGTMGHWTQIWLASKTFSRSKTSIIEILFHWMHAEFRSSSVNIVDANENVLELRRLTGFNWVELADLLNVDRRTLHNWAKGTRVSRKNARHIADTLSLMRYADRGSTDGNATAIFERSGAGTTPFEEIKRGRYDEARRIMSYGKERSELPTPESSFSGEFLPIFMHHKADGSGRVRSLPAEPRPRSRKRDIRRG